MRYLFSLIAICLLSSVSYAQINVPAKVDVHKPIVASSAVDADVYIWNVPKPAVYITVDGGKGLHLWAPAGKYDLRLTTIKVGWEDKKVDYEEHFAQLEVVGSGPKPEPEPEPEPNPGPTAFKQKVSEALKSVKESAIAYKTNIANNYRDIASEAEASPTAWDAATMVAEAKTRNATSLPASVIGGWSGFWPQLAKAFVELRLDVNDLEGHIKAFNDVADVLSK